MKASRCRRCGTAIQRQADPPYVMPCWACGARPARRAADSPRPAARLEAMIHYSSRWHALRAHSHWADAAGFLLILAGGAGLMYLVATSPPPTLETPTALISQLWSAVLLIMT